MRRTGKPDDVHGCSCADCSKFRATADIKSAAASIREPFLEKLCTLGLRNPVSSLSASQLTSQAIAAFRDGRLLDGRATCHYDLILIKHCLKIAMNEWGLMMSSKPVDKVKMPPSSPARNRRLEDGEFERLEEAARQTKKPHIWPIIVFAIETGM